MSFHENATTMSADAGPVPTAVRLAALRQALAHAGAVTAILIDLSAELRQAGAPGLAWDTDYLADRVDALAGVTALLVKSEEIEAGPTDTSDVDRPGQAG